MNTDKERNTFLGSFLLLAVSYIIYFVRYPMWQSFVSVEIISVLLILSYFIVLLVALFLLKKDSRKSLSEVFKNKGNLMIIMGLLFALIYLGLWYLISISLGSNITFESFPALRGFENYVIFSLPLAFSLYLVFSIFGAFAEEVTYRGYVQTRISSKYGIVLGVLVASLFFSLQHIHVFQVNWLIQFFQTQFFHVFIFSIFSGYLYFKSNENIWSVIMMHAFTNAFSVSVPIVVTHTFPFTFYIAEITSFTVMILILRSLPLRTEPTKYPVPKLKRARLDSSYLLNP